MSGSFLRCEAVDAGYGGVQVLFGVDLDVAEGEMVGLLGTNGAGKSTLLRVISGLLPPSAGRVTLAGTDVTRTGPEQLAHLGMAMMPGGRSVFPGLTVAENIRAAAWLSRRDRRMMKPRLDAALERFPVLRRRWETAAGDLSGGEQQMLSLAQAFLARPRLLLIDELSLGLAPSVVDGLVEMVREIGRAGTTVVVVEQSVNTALRLTERAVFMEKGEVRFSGPTADLLDRPDILRAVFLGPEAVGNGRAPVDPAPASARRSSPLASGAAPPPPDNCPALETRGLTKTYGGVTAVDGVSIQLTPGETLGIIGPNGAGKTTLFDLICGFAPADSGRVLLAGRDVTAWGPHRRAGAGLGRSFQDARLWSELTVAETLAVALHRRLDAPGVLPAFCRLPVVRDAEEDLAAEVHDLIDRFGLAAFRDKFIFELSTGSRRIVELAAMAAHRPAVLLLDEPSSGIAQRETEALGAFISRLRAEIGCSVLVIEHSIPVVRELADRLLAMDLGAVIAEGRPQEVLSDERVVTSYLGTAGMPAAKTRTGTRSRAARPRSPRTTEGRTANGKRSGSRRSAPGPGTGEAT